MREHAEIDLIEIIEEQRAAGVMTKHICNDKLFNLRLFPQDFDSFYEKEFSTFSNDKDMERMGVEENMMDYKDFEKNNNSTGFIVSFFRRFFIIALTNIYYRELATTQMLYLP